MSWGSFLIGLVVGGTIFSFLGLFVGWLLARVVFDSSQITNNSLQSWTDAMWEKLDKNECIDIHCCLGKSARVDEGDDWDENEEAPEPPPTSPNYNRLFGQN